MEFSGAHKSWPKLRCALLHTTKFEKLLLFYFITISSVTNLNGIFCNKNLYPHPSDSDILLTHALNPFFPFIERGTQACT